MTLRTTVLVVSTLSIAILMAENTAKAAPFDAIVPTKYRVNTTGIVGGGSPLGALIAATSVTLTQGDLDSMVFSAVETDPSVNIDFSGPINTSLYSPASPGDVIGRTYMSPSPDEPASAALDALVLVGETRINPNAQLTGLLTSFPENYVGTVPVQGSISIGGDFVNFSFEVEFGDFPDHTFVVSAERLSSIPEPSTVVCFSMAGVVMLVRRKR